MSIPSSLALLLLSVIAPLMPAHAAYYEPTGVIAFIRSHDTAIGTNADWFALQGVTSAGTCAKDNGLVVFRIRDDARGQRQFALALAARHAGTPVTRKGPTGRTSRG